MYILYAYVYSAVNITNLEHIRSFSKIQSNMISNTRLSELKMKDQSGIVPDEGHQKLQLKASVPSTVNNNNNEISRNKCTHLTQIFTDEQRYEKSFKFYSKTCFGNSIPTNDCPAIVLKNSSDDFMGNSCPKSSKFHLYDSSSCYNSTTASDVNHTICTNVLNESALNDVSRMSGCGISNGTEKSVCDAKNDFISGQNNNCSIKNSRNVRRKPPMCRTEDQEHAFRQIEDVHNYSKLNRYSYCNPENDRVVNTPTFSSNSSNQDDDDECDDDHGYVDIDDDDDDEEEEEEEDKVNNVEEFVSVDYKQLSASKNSNTTTQQSVTPFKCNSPGITFQQQNKNQDEMSPDALNIEIEGNITPPDHHARRPMNAFLIFCKRHRGIVKDKYKNYENRSITKILGEWWASMDANDKKCYVNLAQQNKDAFFSANPNFKWYKLPAPSLRTLTTRPGNIERGENQCELDNFYTQNNINYNTDSVVEKKKVSYFKLADEKQMGGLNNLMSSNKTATSKDNSFQKALSDGSSFFNSSRKSNIDIEDFCKLKRSNSDKNFSSSEDDFTPKKSVRSCKGKKYQELINSGQISAVNSKKMVSQKPSIDSSDGQYFVMHIDKYKKVQTSCKSNPKKDAQSKKDKRQWVMTHYPDVYRFKKQQLGFVSFDLEEKIKRLPAQCLETYLQHKKNIKRKKKINSRKRSSAQQHNLQEVFLKQTTQSLLCQPKTEIEAKEQVIGSQKRKARKESITRRNITSIQSDVQLLFGSSHTNPPFIIGRRNSTHQSLPVVNQNATSDLLILAEVAANRTETTTLCGERNMFSNLNKI
ncbi:MATH and LRR domain-containing protein PFE0570w [Eupeodes corollae]|uniref:MATH and LRR domain-containing protein PFE0570w n=1 Tax=Eupeodes corollae TaxID=290404 RepID=UPI0024904282|nr:MATH and LRR domain-containing protein PFE0570w [Eupeodes corollae]XP_055911134.1 MATH and LRR domain-containing protein PFE0570w [Eupeodes corollae]